MDRTTALPRMAKCSQDKRGCMVRVLWDCCSFTIQLESLGSLSVPAPPIPPGYLSKTLVQCGGPVSVSSGATTSAVTFGTAFPDTNYVLAIEWVSGSTPGCGTRGKTVNYCTAAFTQVTVPSAFLWAAWRLT